MAARKPLSISLTPELHAFVTELVKAGSYTSSSEVIRAGLRLLRHDEIQRHSQSRSGAPPSAAGSQA
jgi:putative addiction module CopG family antidote